VSPVCHALFSGTSFCQSVISLEKCKQKSAILFKKIRELQVKVLLICHLLLSEINYK